MAPSGVVQADEGEARGPTRRRLVFYEFREPPEPLPAPFRDPLEPGRGTFDVVTEPAGEQNAILLTAALLLFSSRFLPRYGQDRTGLDDQHLLGRTRLGHAETQFDAGDSLQRKLVLA